MPGSLHDILLPRPLDPAWLHGLLFFTFVIHFLFVLLTVGAAVLGLVALVRRHWRSREELDHRSLLRPFFVHKSLAIVLGVGALLLMQLGNTVPFFTGINRLARWGTGALVFQLVAGVGLYASLPRSPSPLATVVILAAVLFAALLLSRLARGGLLLRRATASELAPFKAAAMNAWDAWRNVTYDQPYSMYRGSCNICHGAVTSGTGREAWRLAVPPEDLSALRASSSELRRILSSGVPGTAMPRFGIYTRDRQDGIISLLRTAGLREAPEPLPVSISPASGVTAHAVFVSRCGFCHGPDGTGAEQSSHFRRLHPTCRCCR